MVTKVLILVAIFSVVLASSEETPEESRLSLFLPPSISVTEGVLFGKIERGNVKPYEAYLGIPYAAPPIGALRFKKPHRPPLYGQVWNSTYHRSQCMQNNYITKEIEGSEDCLYLNVFKPIRAIPLPLLLPVLVFMHGGAFKIGTSDPKFFQPDYLMDTQDVIVVTLQYRLGVFGFLSSGDGASKGNFGLKDQRRALKWLQSNIIRFGGNPKAVTLMGDSAGGASTHFHMMAARSNDLFQKAIMIGGNALCFWALERNPRKQMREFASIAGIPNANTADSFSIVAALATMSANDLQKFSASMYSPHPISPVFRPTIEGSWKSALVTADPRVVWKNGNYQQRPFLTVTMKNEQGILDDSFFDMAKRQHLLADFDNSLLELAGLCRSELETVKKYFFKDPPTLDNIFNITILQGDRWFYSPMYTMAKQYVNYQNKVRNPMDTLQFRFNTSFSLAKIFSPFINPANGPYKHDMLLYLFTFPALQTKIIRGPAENKAKDMMVKLITQYVMKGFENSNDYPVCTSDIMDRDGICPYLVVGRNNNDVLLTTSQEFDFGSYAVLGNL